MREIRSYLGQRSEEMDHHLSLLYMLDRRTRESSGAGDQLRVEVRQVLILKSSILVHLYNIVEATMNQVLDEVARQVSTYHPKMYTEAFFKEWIRYSAGTNDSAGPEKLLEKVTATGQDLISEDGWTEMRIIRGSGNWDDKEIQRIAGRLDIVLDIDPEIARAASENFSNDESRLTYLRRRRNSLAHGHSTFEEGAQDRTYDELVELAKVVLKYVREVIECFERFVDVDGYLETRMAEAS